jgi:hypothetical protein
MQVGHFRFDYPASVAFDQLSPDDQSQLVAQLESLAETSPAAWSTKVVKQMPDDPSLYMLIVNPIWRAFLRVAEGEQPIVLSLIRREALQMFAKSKV